MYINPTADEKTKLFALCRNLDKIAIPLWMAGATLAEAYQAAMRRVDGDCVKARGPSAQNVLEFTEDLG